MKPTLLFIEDDSDSLALYVRHLSQEYDILIATSHEEAQNCLDAHKISAAIVEPVGVDAWVWDFLADLKANPEMAATPVIFCTVLDQRKRGLDLDVCAYLTKPVYPRVLAETLHRIFARVEES